MTAFLKGHFGVDINLLKYVFCFGLQFLAQFNRKNRRGMET